MIFSPAGPLVWVEGTDYFEAHAQDHSFGMSTDPDLQRQWPLSNSTRKFSQVSIIRSQDATVKRSETRQNVNRR